MKLSVVTVHPVYMPTVLKNQKNVQANTFDLVRNLGILPVLNLPLCLNMAQTGT